MKRLLPPKTKVGHTGTLDPLASGLLVILIGRSTRLSRYVTDLDKAYTATARSAPSPIRWTQRRNITSLDAPCPTKPPSAPPSPASPASSSRSPDDLSPQARGVRLYDLHRRGVTVERDPCPVTVHAFDLIAQIHEQTATFEVSCSSGTYVRTLIADLAEAPPYRRLPHSPPPDSRRTPPVESAPDPDDLSSGTILTT